MARRCAHALDRDLPGGYAGCAPRANDRNGETVDYWAKGTRVSAKTVHANADLRILKTRDAIWEAVLSLTEEKGFERITVSDIARRARINRTTFYAHFTDKETVIRDGVAAMLRNLIARWEPAPERISTAQATTPHANTVLWFDHVRENARFYRAMFVTGELARFSGEIEGLFHRLAMTRLGEHPAPPRPTMPAEIVMSATIALNLGLVKWWLRDGLKDSPETMAIRYQELLVYGTYGVLRLPVPPIPEA